MPPLDNRKISYTTLKVTTIKSLEKTADNQTAVIKTAEKQAVINTTAEKPAVVDRYAAESRYTAAVKGARALKEGLPNCKYGLEIQIFTMFSLPVNFQKLSFKVRSSDIFFVVEK